MTAFIKIEGQEIQVTSEEIAQDDQKILAFISPFYPAYATARVTRKQEKRGEEEVTVITLSKKAGSKGSTAAVEILQNAPVEVNPILSMSWRIKALCANHPMFDFQTSLELSPQIEESIQAGRREEQLVASSLRLLKSAKPIASEFPISGF